MLRRKATHKSWKRKSYLELKTQRTRFQNGKSDHRKQKDIWNDEWKADHKHLKFCWSCGVRPDGNPDNVITQMHATKQRYIRTREDCRRSAFVCWKEHRSYDEAQGLDVHSKMAAFVDGLIEKINGLHI